MQDTTPERDAAAAVQQRYSTAAKRLREDRDLTDQARTRRLADEWKTARVELDRLRSAEQARLTARSRHLETRLFGPTGREVTDAVSMRDAQDRASQLRTPAEAAQLLARAEQNGDHVLARAIAQHAVQQSRTSTHSAMWDEVLGSFVDARPDVTPVVEELAQIERLTSRTVLGPYSLVPPHGLTPANLNAATPTVGSAA